eukprot:gene7686-10385_t
MRAQSAELFCTDSEDERKLGRGSRAAHTVQRSRFNAGLLMSDEESVSIPIPALAKALLEPFRRVVGRTDDQAPEQPVSIELTFVPPYSRPNDEQLVEIGRVATVWSIVERMLGKLLTRLAMAPEYPGMAITKDLGLDAQAKAIKSLMLLHSSRYRYEIIGADWLEVITGILRDFDKLRLQRNIAVHTVWFRMGDGLDSLRPRPVTEAASRQSPSPHTTAIELRKLAEDIQRLADALFVVV